jgi:hypothetical protein
MWRSLLVGCTTIPIAVLSGLAVGATYGWRSGIVAFSALFGSGLIIAMVILLKTRNLSRVDLWLPVPIAIIWSTILSIFSVGSELFTAPACIGSAFLFSLSLSTARKFGQSDAWVIAPALVFMYEMLPINIPGPFDDYFSFGGTATIVVIQLLLRTAHSNPPVTHIIDVQPSKVEVPLIEAGDPHHVGPSHNH